MLLIVVQEYIKRIPHLNYVSGGVVHKVILRKEFGKLEWYNDLWKVDVIKGTEEFDDYLEKEMFKDFYSREYKEKMVLWNNGMIDETVMKF